MKWTPIKATPAREKIPHSAFHIPHSRQRAAAAVEYVLILTFVVIPLGAMLPVFLKMITLYASRCVAFIHLPIG